MQSSLRIRISAFAVIVVAGLALVPRLFQISAFRVRDDALLNTVLTIAVDLLIPATAIGFGVLLVYSVTADIFTGRSVSIPVTSAVGFLVAAGYLVSMVLVWVEPRLTIRALELGLVRFLRIIESVLPILNDPVTIRTIEHEALSVLWNLQSGITLRSTAEFSRWPLYLVVSYFIVATFADKTRWPSASSSLNRTSAILFGTGFALIYGLILSHNFFPPADGLPWRSTVTLSWLVGHTLVVTAMLFALQLATGETHHHSVTRMLVLFVLIGMLISLIDGLSPVPELLILSTGLIALVRSNSINPRQGDVSPQNFDVEGRLLNGITEAWKSPAHIFPLLVAFQGIWIAGWLLWLVGTAIFGQSVPPEATLITRGILLIVFSPLVIAAVYIAVYWLLHFEHINQPSINKGIPPDALVFPSFIISGTLTAEAAFEVSALVALGTIVVILISLFGIWWSLTNRDRVVLPPQLRQYTIPIAGSILFFMLALSTYLNPSPYGERGTYLVFLLVTLIPLSLFPYIEQSTIGLTTKTRVQAFLLVGATIFGGMYLYLVDAVSVLVAGFLGAVALLLGYAHVLAAFRREHSND